jgi:hypothetical protein
MNFFVYHSATVQMDSGISVNTPRNKKATDNSTESEYLLNLD